MKKIVIVRGAGDIASGIIVKLHQCGFKVIATEIEKPTAIRRHVSFSEAVYEDKVDIEDVVGQLASLKEIDAVSQEDVTVIVDRELDILNDIEPFAFVDATLNKKNNSSKITMAAIVIGVGPGFEATKDCHAVVETKRGHDLGRVSYHGRTSENTGVPGNIGGYAQERVVRASVEGALTIRKDIGSVVKKGAVIASVEGQPIYATIDGLIRGMIHEGSYVEAGMKVADIDPRLDQVDNCYKISDKARCVAGGVLEAILCLKGGINHV